MNKDECTFLNINIHVCISNSSTPYLALQINKYCQIILNSIYF